MADDLWEARRKRIEQRLDAADGRQLTRETVGMERCMFGEEPGTLIVAIEGKRVRLYSGITMRSAMSVRPEPYEPSIAPDDAERLARALIEAARRARNAK